MEKSILRNLIITNSPVFTQTRQFKPKNLEELFREHNQITTQWYWIGRRHRGHPVIGRKNTNVLRLFMSMRYPHAFDFQNRRITPKPTQDINPWKYEFQTKWHENFDTNYDPWISDDVKELRECLKEYTDDQIQTTLMKYYDPQDVLRVCTEQGRTNIIVPKPRNTVTEA